MADDPMNELRSKAHWRSRRVRLLTEIKRMKKIRSKVGPSAKKALDRYIGQLKTQLAWVRNLDRSGDDPSRLRSFPAPYRLRLTTWRWRSRWCCRWRAFPATDRTAKRGRQI
jgi:hypothetical protein